MTIEGHNISNQSGISKWFVDAEKCFSFWAKNRSDCATCMRVCPFNKPRGMIHDVSRALIGQGSPIINQFLIWVDDILGYHKRIPAKRFWDSN